MVVNERFQRVRLLAAVLAAVLLCVFVANAQAPPPAKTIAGGVLNGKAISLPKPEYPEDARRAGVSGVVKVHVLIDESGMVVSAQAVSGMEMASLQRAAEAAALRATFSPTLLSGRPVKVSGVITYSFVGPSNEQRVKVMGVVSFLAAARQSSSDLEKLNEIFYSDYRFEDAAEEFPQFAADITSLKDLKSLTPQKRLELVDKAMSSIRLKLDESGKWQFDAGVELGNIFGQMFKAVGDGSDEPDLSKLDEAALRSSLKRIGELALSAPTDFPVDVLAKLKDLAATGKAPLFETEEKAENFVTKMGALINTIAPAAFGDEPKKTEKDK